MQPHEFVQLLEATQAANNNIRDEATQNIMKLRETNIDLFLNLSGAVISSNSFSDLSRSVALVLTYRTLILIQTTNSAKFLIQQYKEYLTSLLEICYNLFFTNIGVHAAPLLAEICDIYLDDDYNTTIIQELCLKIQPISDLKFIDNALIAFYQITQNEYLYDIQAKPLLEIVCSYLGVAEIPPESKVRCVYILSEMINDYMEAIIASQLTNVILQALGIVDLKAAAYKCVYALAKYFYVEAFQSISEKAINAALTDLGQINDDNLHDEIFEFIRAIAISEKLNQINNGIIQNCLQPILQASMMLTVKFFDSYDYR
ncbi:hypothetical protein GPJ56_006880 [Histomonas meleagridis]|nr:hypothetical protein GPJ56_006880 [Histomonas meleagridis]